MEPLVSLITPFYNSEGKINIFLDSVLKQTYNNIELILINDGSIDNTEEVVLEYEKKFRKRGYSFIYKKQENMGQSIALNNGLKIFNGKYLMWPDSDDILLKDNIKKKVEFLENNQEFGLVYCNAEFVENKNISKVIQCWNKPLSKVKKNIFEDILLAKILFAPGAWMARSKYFLEVRPDRDIEVNKRGFKGQNWQMLLPLAYKYPVGKVDEYLFKYVVYKNSDSHKKRSYEEALEYINGKEIILKAVLKNIKMSQNELNKYLDLVNIFINMDKLNCSISYKNKKDFEKIYTMMKNKMNLKMKIKCILFKYNILDIIKLIYK